MWIYETKTEHLRAISTGFGEAVLRHLHRTGGQRIWDSCRDERQRLFHQGHQCPAGRRPRVLDGSGSCQDCEPFYLDLLVLQTVTALSALRIPAAAESGRTRRGPRPTRSTRPSATARRAA